MVSEVSHSFEIGARCGNIVLMTHFMEGILYNVYIFGLQKRQWANDIT